MTTKNSRLVGLSTGALSGVLNDGLTPGAVALGGIMTGGVIELNIHSVSDLAKLSDDVCDIVSEFHIITVHLPSRASDCIKYGENTSTIDILSLIEVVCQRIGPRYIVVHPDLVVDWGVFTKYNLPLAIENLDIPGNKFSHLAGLIKFFSSHPRFGFVLDLHHWVTAGNSLNDIPKLLKNVSLRGVHLSGYSGVMGDRKHYSLANTDSSSLVRALEYIPRDVPIFLEGVLECPHQINSKERAKIVRQLINDELWLINQT